MTSESSAKETQRTCIGCRRSNPPTQLVRLTLRNFERALDQGHSAAVTVAHAIVWPPEVIEAGTHRTLGRSAYVHRNFSCVRKLAEKGVLEHAFRLPRGAIAKSSREALLGSLYAVPEELGNASHEPIKRKQFRVRGI